MKIIRSIPDSFIKDLFVNHSIETQKFTFNNVTSLVFKKRFSIIGVCSYDMEYKFSVYALDSISEKQKYLLDNFADKARNYFILAAMYDSETKKASN